MSIIPSQATLASQARVRYAQSLVTKYKDLPTLNLPELLRIHATIATSIHTTVDLRDGSIIEPDTFYALNSILLELCQRIQAHNPPM
jgi:hypothetical protein